MTTAARLSSIDESLVVRRPRHITRAQIVRETAASVVVWLQVSLVILVAGFALVFWTRPVLIVGDSMTPSIDRGDVVITDKPNPAEVGAGQIIVFDSAGQNVTHRVVGFEGESLLRTKGDANGTIDTDTVARDDVVGRARVVVPMIGYPLVWIREHLWLPLTLWLSVTVAAAALGRPVLCSRTLREQP